MLTRVKHLFRNLLIYGVGDTATSIVSLLLLPIFTSVDKTTGVSRYLTPADYGVITMLLTIEAVTKVLFRWGVDTAFMRLYYDCDDERGRQRLASTIFLFLLGVNGTLVLAGIASAGWVTHGLLGPGGRSILVVLTLVNTFVVNFYFIPFQVLRIEERSRKFIAISIGRSSGTVVARLVFVIWARLGVLGIVLADIVVTTVLSIYLIRLFTRLIRPVFSAAVLREALSFGLPRVPHTIAQQVIGFADRYFLKAFATLADVGVYSIGATFGLALKLFLSSFESAWTPFFLAAMHERDAKKIYRTVSTYVIAVLVLLVAGLCALAPGVVRLFTSAKFHAAAAVTPWIALGVMFQGLYLVGSIGLVIKKRTTLYPISTGTAAAVSLAANRMLIPHYGILGAAWANTISYATLAVMTVGFSQYVYPISYEWGRLARIAAAGMVGFIAGSRVVVLTSPLVGILAGGTATVAAYVAVLAVTGFFHSGEMRVLMDLRDRMLRYRSAAPLVANTTDVEMAGEIVGTAPDPADDAMRQELPRGRRGGDQS